jgi:hypothetical protein
MSVTIQVVSTVAGFSYALLLFISIFQAIRTSRIKGCTSLANLNIICVATGYLLFMGLAFTIAVDGEEFVQDVFETLADMTLVYLYLSISFSWMAICHNEQLSKSPLERLKVPFILALFAVTIPMLLNLFLGISVAVIWVTMLVPSSLVLVYGLRLSQSLSESGLNASRLQFRIRKASVCMFVNLAVVVVLYYLARVRTIIDYFTADIVSTGYLICLFFTYAFQGLIVIWLYFPSSRLQENSRRSSNLASVFADSNEPYTQMNRQSFSSSLSSSVHRSSQL